MRKLGGKEVQVNKVEVTSYAEAKLIDVKKTNDRYKIRLWVFGLITKQIKIK